MFDNALFEYEMKKRNISKGDMCTLLNISRSAYYRKCNGRSEFTQSEMQIIRDVLGEDAVIRIFFGSKVS